MTNKTETLSRRDQLAAMAMQALMVKEGNATRKEIARLAVQQADLLIEALAEIQA